MANRFAFEKVSSKNLAEIGYNPVAKELHIKFNYDRNRVYVYGVVTQRTFNSLKNAESVGSYFHEYVRYKIPELRRYVSQSRYLD